MTHILKQFGNYPLPTAMPTDDLSTGEVETALQDSIGGKWNYFATAQRLPRSQQIRHAGLYVGEVRYRVTSSGDYRVTSSGDYRVTSPSVVADLHGKIGDLKSMIGQLDQLWRERLSDGELTWKQCRLLHVKHEEVIENANAVSEVESFYETTDVGWRSATAITTSGSATAAAVMALNVQNGGAMPVRDAILSIARTSGTITAVTITGSGIDITWTGSIGAGQTLVIDGGDQTVVVGSTDQYSGLTLYAGHSADDWLPLAVGTNVLYVTVTGGNATVSVGHYNQWP